MIEQRVRRNKLFSPPLVNNVVAGATSRYIPLVNIESLLGTTGTKYILGMLGQDERKQYFLEDRTMSIPLDLSQAQYTKGLFTPNCIVLVQGTVVDDVLRAEFMTFPPPETRAESLAILGDVDPLGQEISKQQLQRIRELEAQDNDATFVILSDVHLDDPTVMMNLKVLFEGYEPIVPKLFVLMGNFTLYPVGQGSDSYSIQQYVEYFDALAALLAQFKQLANESTFVFIPGPNDVGSSGVFPRHRLPEFCVESLASTLSHVIFATNPCRIRYYTQDFVIVRNDLQQKMRRHTVVPMVATSEQEENIEEGDVIDTSDHLAKTIVDQAHLSPLPLSVQPIYWAFDSSMHLFPLPNVLILADKNQQYQFSYSETGVINPGPFYIDYSFILYRPATNTTEFSSINQEVQNRCFG